MTKEEIKEEYSMADVAARYGLLPNRRGFIRCPFHPGDREASLKLYPKDFHCFACGAHGDIFTFIQMQEEIPFHEAFQALGGTDGEPSFRSRLRRYQAEKRRQKRGREEAKKWEEKRRNAAWISACRACMEESEPLSDLWCYAYNVLQYQLYLHSRLTGIPF
jgi:DNA primase